MRPVSHFPRVSCCTDSGKPPETRTKPALVSSLSRLAGLLGGGRRPERTGLVPSMGLVPLVGRGASRRESVEEREARQPGVLARIRGLTQLPALGGNTLIMDRPNVAAPVERASPGTSFTVRAAGTAGVAQGTLVGGREVVAVAAEVVEVAEGIDEFATAQSRSIGCRLCCLESAARPTR